MENRNILKSLKSLLPVFFVILSAVLSRILPHPPNFTPVGGIALFSGAYLAGPSSFLVPLLIMIASDLILGFHSTILYVYGSFILIVLLGKMMGEKNSLVRLATASISSSLVFFLITNFGVWASTPMYSKDMQGLLNAYFMGVPFFKNTLFGDLFYTFILFYGVALASHFSQRMLLDFLKKREYR